MAKNPPSRSSPEVDFLQRMLVRNSSYAGAAFLDSADEATIRAILDDAIKHGPTDEVVRRAHSALVLVQEWDRVWKFLDEESRKELEYLINPDSRPQTEKPVKAPKPVPRGKTVGAGEAIAAGGVIVSVTLATLLILQNPHTAGSAFWVGFWGAIDASALIGDTRQRCIRKNERAAVGAGLIVVLTWAAAAVGIVLLGGAGAGSVAFWGFILASGISRGALGLDVKDNN